MADPQNLQLIDFANATPELIAEQCAAAIAACDADIAAIASSGDERTFANTLVALETAVDHVLQASGTYGFLAYVANDADVRNTAHEWEQKLDQYLVGLGFREDLYEAVRAFAGTDGARQLAADEARLLDRTLRDYRRKGFELEPAQRERVQELFNRLIELGTKFRRNIDEWDDAILVRRDELAGLPDAFIDGLQTSEVDGETRYRVSLDYPEMYPFLSNAQSGERRKELFIANYRKGGQANVELLEEAIRVRQEIATLLGYDSWAAYVLEERMAKERGRVEEFLLNLQAQVEPKAARDMAALGTLSDGAPVENWDWRYYVNRVLREEYAVDEFEVARYFPLDACIRGLFDVTSQLLGIRYEPVADGQAWDAEVQAFDLYDTDGTEPIARFYMDLFPRPNTYGHAAAFTLRQGRVLEDGTYQKPVSAIVANFTRPTATAPSLLRHSEVVTFFHEFGHILHQTLTTARFAEFSGSSTERDFVEAPSQMLEHWCWDPEAVQRFARHFETGEPLPTELLNAMIEAKNVGSGIATLRQLYFARLDLAYHSPGFSGDTTAVMAELHPVTGWPAPEDTYFQAGFGHLFGYDAGYYGYLWSKVFGDDMFTRFEAAGVLDGATGRTYRATVLERGGSVDGDVLVREFLGREPNTAAFLRDLGLEDGAAADE